MGWGAGAAGSGGGGRLHWALVGRGPAGAEPRAASLGVEAEAFAAMGRGTRRARGSLAWLLLLRLWPSWPVGGAEAFQGECSPRGSRATVRGPLGQEEGRAWGGLGESLWDLRRDPQLYWAGLGAHTCTLCSAATVRGPQQSIGPVPP